MPRALILLPTALLAGCAFSGPPPRRLVVAGSRHFAPLMAAFAEADPAGRADFEATLSSRAVADVREGLADVALVGRDLRPDETGVVRHALGRDAIAVAVHRDNPIASLTENQVAGLFTRVYGNWRELGGFDRPIVVVGLAEGRDVREAFLDFLGLKAAQVRADPTVADSEQVVQAVASRPGAVGYVSLASARAALKAAPVRLVPLAGVVPGPDTVLAGKYLFVRPIICVTRPGPLPSAKALLDLARSPAGQALFAEQGYVAGGP